MLFCLFVACAVVLVILLNLSTVRETIDGFLSSISPLFYGLIFAYLLNPVMKRFESWAFPLFNKLNFFKTSKKPLPKRLPELWA